MNIVWQNFHFLRPEWFWCLLPLFFLYLLVKKLQIRNSGWQRVIPEHLYSHLIGAESGTGTAPPYRLLALCWVLAVVALAGPTWERLPQPVFQLKAGHVVVLDMSMSMRATDISPDRLSRAKYKAIDLVKAIDEGETGLVAYAGDAFVISPLTRDAGNLTALLPSLSPEIMPVSGSDPLLGIETAASLLENAGYQNGQIYWITDGIDRSQLSELQEYVRTLPFDVSILGVGTEQGAPIRQLDGELLKRSDGSIVIPRMRAEALQTVSEAGSGRYISITADEGDIHYLTSRSALNSQANEETEEESRSGDQWAELGPYLVLLLLPFAAYAFRRGVLLLCVFSIYSLVPNQEAQAQTQPAESQPAQPGSHWWQAPFLNEDQEGYQAFTNQNYEQAAEEFTDPGWEGAAHYKAGNYQAALEAYSQLNTPDAVYNQGNALAQLGELDAAIAKYDQVLAQNPDFADAAANKKLLEELQKQQDQEQQNQQNQQQSQSSDQQQNSSQQQDPSQQDSQSGKSSQSQGDSQAQPQDQEKQEGGAENQDSADQQQNQQQEQQSAQNGEQPEENKEEAASEQARQEANDQRNEQDGKASAQMSEADELTDAEKEQLQRLENLKRRIPDDPAYLLKRKMQLEAQQRRQQRLPADRREEW